MKCLFLSGLMMILIMNVHVRSAVGEVASDNDLRELSMQTGTVQIGSETDDVAVLEEYMVTKEVEGEIASVTETSISVKQKDSKEEIALIVDAETLLYINDEKSELKDLKQGDDIFAYYVDENGILKCDWAEVIR